MGDQPSTTPDMGVPHMRTPKLADVLPVHPVTGVTAIGIGKRGPIWPVMGGSQPTGEPTPAPVPAPQPPEPVPAPAPTPVPAPQPATGPDGYPANTPVEQMTAEQQASYWRAHARKHEERNKAMTAEQSALKKKADEYDKLEAASKTEQEKAVEAAKAEGAATATAEVLQRVGGQLVEAHIRGQMAGRMAETQLVLLLDNLDRTRFLTAEHAVDTDKVAAWVTGIAPAPQPGQPQPPPRDLGQGQHTPANGSNSVAAGRELYKQLNPSSK